MQEYLQVDSRLHYFHYYILTCRWLRALTLHGLTVVTKIDWSLPVYSFSVSPSAVPVRLCAFVFKLIKLGIKNKEILKRQADEVTVSFQRKPVLRCVSSLVVEEQE